MKHTKKGLRLHPHSQKSEKSRPVLSYGFIHEPLEPEAWVFGSASLPSYATKEILQPDGNWEAFLPVEEQQNQHGLETMACTVFATLNICEIIIKRKYNLDVNFSDRWLAWASDISPTGANPQKIAETLRQGGVPNQGDWDFTSDLRKWEDFYQTPPAKLIALARAFLSTWDFKHYVVPGNKEAIKDALKFSPVGMSVSAWTRSGDVYDQRGAENHWCMTFGINDNYKMFDSYDSFKKLYSKDAKIAIAKGYYIGKKVNVERAYLFTDLLQSIFGDRRLLW